MIAKIYMNILIIHKLLIFKYLVAVSYYNYYISIFDICIDFNL